jgi:membrane associated rhomboid family serine protease
VMGAVSAARDPDASQGGIAFGAHIGGFIAGLALVAFFKHRHVPLWRRH